MKIKTWPAVTASIAFAGIAIVLAYPLAYTVYWIPVDFEFLWVLGCAAALASIALSAVFAFAVSSSIRIAGKWSRAACLWLGRVGGA